MASSDRSIAPDGLTSEPWVLISCHEAQGAEARAVAAELERRGIPARLPEHRMGGRAVSDDEMAEAVQGSRAVVVFFSKEYAESEECRVELNLTAAEPGKRVLVVRTDRFWIRDCTTAETRGLATLITRDIGASALYHRHKPDMVGATADFVARGILGRVDDAPTEGAPSSSSAAAAAAASS